MKFNKSNEASSGPSSAIGIMRFFDSDGSNPKMSPEFVVAVAVVFSLIIVAFHLMG